MGSCSTSGCPRPSWTTRRGASAFPATGHWICAWTRGPDTARPNGFRAPGGTRFASVLYTYGEERHARRVARAIVAAREIAPIDTTGRLAEVVAAATPRSAERRHPATRAFLALRLKVNQEIEELSAALPQALEVLGKGGRLLVIAFHSLEDRMAKRFLRDEARPSRPPRQFPVPAEERPARLRLIAGPIRPPAAEVARNPRCRSAVLRVAERLE